MKLYPNGECVIYRKRIARMQPKSQEVSKSWDSWLFSCWKTFLNYPEAHRTACLYMGLSLLSNFDKMVKPLKPEVSPAPETTKRYGLKGITRTGARTVRNAAHLMQESCGKHRLTFATVTVPDLPIEQMRLLQERWHKVVELYRLTVKRRLQAAGIRAYILTVSEVQEKRYDRTGLPILHLHSLWQGRGLVGGWAVSPADHDKIWRQSVNTVVGGTSVSFKSSANLKSVRSSASGYMGKYMTKGSAVVKKMVADGYGDWLPRQWWNASRELTRWVKRETVTAPQFADFLLNAADGKSKCIWSFVGHVGIDIGDKQEYWLATFGRLQPVIANDIRTHCVDAT